MAGAKKKKFSINQKVVIRFSDRKLVGTVSHVAPEPGTKRINYSVLGEDGKTYPDLGVDTVMNYCIDTKLTKILYAKLGLDVNGIPDSGTEDVESTLQTVDEDTAEPIVAEEPVTIDLELIPDAEDLDPNY